MSTRGCPFALKILTSVALVGLLSACGASPPGTTASVGPSSSVVTDLRQIRAEIESRYGGQLLSIGDGAGTVVVGLRSTGVAAAAEILARYGTSVDITVGLFPYPAPAGSTNVCAAGLGPLLDPGPLRANIELPNRSVGHEAAFYATVRLSNVGSEPLTLETGQPLSILLFEPDGTIPVGTAAGGVAGTGLSLRLQPGAASSIPAAGGTASCDLRLGYELPDGPYVARAVVEIDRTDPGMGAALGVFLSEPLTITVATG